MLNRMGYSSSDQTVTQSKEQYHLDPEEVSVVFLFLG